MDFEKLLNFLEELKQNNNKAWFDANRLRYSRLRSDWLDFVQEVINRVSVFDSTLKYLEPKQCIFRLNRDIRFSNDKTPYKTNFGMSLSKYGKKDNFCGYYLHIEPNNSFVAGGCYMPDAMLLAAIRQEIDYNANQFTSIVKDKKFIKTFGKIAGEKLQRPPKGYDSSNPMIEFLKLKSFLAEKKLSNDEIKDKKIHTNLQTHFQIMYPLNKFLYQANG
ncbi:MAG: DUF2461 domain-containing protein [Bacteroidia bacterium]|nr:DUF2461 domain-containing protein [Bacteroidia bacterium]